MSFLLIRTMWLSLERRIGSRTLTSFELNFEETEESLMLQFLFLCPNSTNLVFFCQYASMSYGANISLVIEQPNDVELWLICLQIADNFRLTSSKEDTYGIKRCTGSW